MLPASSTPVKARCGIGTFTPFKAEPSSDLSSYYFIYKLISRMQTFLPYANFKQSAKCLDYKRLGKQRVECKQILKALFVNNYGWKNHPIVKMWKNYELALSEYYNVILNEWISRGYKNSMPYISLNNVKINYPPWLGNIDFHDSHKSNLLRKDKLYYSKYWNISDNKEYVWF